MNLRAARAALTIAILSAEALATVGAAAALEADQFGNAATKIRMTFFNLGPNQVRQLGHQSTDGGKTWTVTFDLTYVRK